MLENRKKTILAVDDDITALTTLRTILEATFEVCLAKSTDIAITILNTTEIDLILLDLEMPGISGLAFLASLQKNPIFYYIPVIVVSSHGITDVIIEAKKAGAKDFAVKPVSPKILLDKIHAVLKGNPIKITREVLIRRLALLDTACKQGKSSRVEEVLEELDLIHYNMDTDREIAEICKYARGMEYNLALTKIEKLLGILGIR